MEEKNTTVKKESVPICEKYAFTKQRSFLILESIV